MEAETRARRETEEQRVSVLRDTISKLEKTLNAEIKRRVEANKALQAMFESQINNVQEKLEAAFMERLDSCGAAVETLQDRISVVERDFAMEKDKYMHDMEEKNSLVAKDLMNMQAGFESERLARAEREAQLAKRLGDFEYRADAKFEQERALREQKYQHLREELEESKRLREKGDEKFQCFILEEIASLKNGLVMESQAREHSDDDIVQALNHYTRALQDGLRIVNSA